MRDGLIIGDLEAPSVVYGVHGTTGLSKWKCLARRSGLFGSWEAIEWAWLPPGGVSGEHVHTRTEEIYFIVSGRGEMTLDGEPRTVGAGDLILTGLGTRHGLRNTENDALGWLVIELLSPATSAVLQASLAGDSRRNVTNMEKQPLLLMKSAVFDLRQVREVNPRSVFTGPLRAIRLIDLEPGQQMALSSAGAEHTVFVLGGSGHITSGDVKVPLCYGVSVTLPLGTEAAIDAGPERLECFMASLGVPEGNSQ